MSSLDEKRTVNQSLGESPSVGIVPGTQLIPWVLIFVIGWYAGDILGQLLGASIVLNLCTIAWLIFSWTLLTGRRPWIFASYFLEPPNWCCGYYTYQPLLKND